MKYLYQSFLIIAVVIVFSVLAKEPAVDVLAEEVGDMSGCVVSVQKLTGEWISGSEVGRTNGCRPTYRFWGSTGADYCPGGDCVVKISCENGDKGEYSFKNPGIPESCPPGAERGTPWRYEQPDGFLWKSRGGSTCVLAVFIPKTYGEGACEPGAGGGGDVDLMDLVNEWRDISEKIHRSGDLAAAQSEYDEIKEEMDAIKKEALQIVPEGSCDYIIYGDDPGFHHYNPHSFDSATSAIILCPLSPELVSCTGFVPNINPLTGKMWPDKNRQIFIKGTPKSGPLTINCLGKDGKTYSYKINDGNTYTNGVCQ